MSDTNHTAGRFVWRELYTSDMEAAKRFYGEVAGWRFRDAKMPGMTYWLIDAGEVEVGGMFNPPGVPSFWNCYVSVDDVDAATRAAAENGAKVLNGPMDVPSVGRMSTITDPQGAVVSLFRSANSQPPKQGRPSAGEFCWEQLNTTDVEGAKAFYTKVVGWSVGSFEGMATFNWSDGPMCSSASVMTAPPGVPAHWVTNIAVPELARANERVKRMGGAVLMDRVEIPKVGAISVVRDNVGATVCLYEPAAG